MRNTVLFIFIAFLASCAPREKLITGSWKFKDMEFENANDSAAKDFAQKVRAQMITNINFEMKADSTYTIWQLKDMKAIHGKWWFSADKKMLFTKTDLALTQSKVLKLTKNTLIFETKDPTSGQLAKMICVAKAPVGSK